MLNHSDWWTCPGCKSYKLLTDKTAKTITCSFCGKTYEIRSSLSRLNTSNSLHSGINTGNDYQNDNQGYYK